MSNNADSRNYGLPYTAGSRIEGKKDHHEAFVDSRYSDTTAHDGYTTQIPGSTSWGQPPIGGRHTDYDGPFGWWEAGDTRYGSQSGQFGNDCAPGNDRSPETSGRLISGQPGQSAFQGDTWPEGTEGASCRSNTAQNDTGSSIASNGLSPEQVAKYKEGRDRMLIAWAEKAEKSAERSEKFLEPYSPEVIAMMKEHRMVGTED